MIEPRQRLGVYLRAFGEPNLKARLRATRAIAGACSESAQRTNKTSGHDENKIGTPLKTAVTDRAMSRIPALCYTEFILFPAIVYVAKLVSLILSLWNLTAFTLDAWGSKCYASLQLAVIRFLTPHNNGTVHRPALRPQQQTS